MVASNRPLDTRSIGPPVTSRTSKAQPVGKTLVSVGSVVAGLAASSCCVLPLLFLALGISGAWIGNLTALAPYQPYFVVVTLGLLAAGFFMVYRKPKMVCAPRVYCRQTLLGPDREGEPLDRDRDHRRGARVSLSDAVPHRNMSLEVNMRKLLFRCVTMVMALVGSPVPAAEKSVTLHVDNMTCATCPPVVKKSLGRIDGVSGSRYRSRRRPRS